MAQAQVRECFKDARLRKLRADAVRKMRSAKTKSALLQILLAALEAGLPNSEIRLVLREKTLGSTVGLKLPRLDSLIADRAVGILSRSGDTCVVLDQSAVTLRMGTSGELLAAALWSEGDRGAVVVYHSGGFLPRELEFATGLADLTSCFIQTVAVVSQATRDTAFACIGRCASLAAHDVAKQLWCIRTLLRRARSENAASQSDIDDAAEIAQSVASSMRTLVQVGRGLSGGETPGSVRVGLAVDAAIRRVKMLRSGATFNVMLEPKTVSLGVSVLANSVLENLLDNAALASPFGEAVSVRGRAERGILTLAVENTNGWGPKALPPRLGSPPERLGTALRLLSELIGSVDGYLEVREVPGRFLAELRLPVLDSLTESQSDL